MINWCGVGALIVYMKTKKNMSSFCGLWPFFMLLIQNVLVFFLF